MVLYGVSTTRGQDAASLRTLAEATGGRVFEIPALDQLQVAFREILEEFRSRYTLMFTPECRKRSGWHAVEVAVKGNVSVNARRGYYVPK
jgi:VWFA-related protein